MKKLSSFLIFLGCALCMILSVYYIVGLLQVIIGLFFCWGNNQGFCGAVGMFDFNPAYVHFATSTKSYSLSLVLFFIGFIFKFVPSKN